MLGLTRETYFSNFESRLFSRTITPRGHQLEVGEAVICVPSSFRRHPPRTFLDKLFERLVLRLASGATGSCVPRGDAGPMSHVKSDGNVIVLWRFHQYDHTVSRGVKCPRQTELSLSAPLRAELYQSSPRRWMFHAVYLWILPDSDKTGKQSTEQQTTAVFIIFIRLDRADSCLYGCRIIRELRGRKE